MNCFLNVVDKATKIGLIVVIVAFVSVTAVAPTARKRESEKENTVSLVTIATVCKTTEANSVDLGEFKLTAYCPCKICSGKWGRSTSTGVIAAANHTVAVDPSVIPYGTELIINGQTYVAEDRGAAVTGKTIDIFFDTHKEAVKFGVSYADVQMKGSDY